MRLKSNSLIFPMFDVDVINICEKNIKEIGFKDLDTEYFAFIRLLNYFRTTEKSLTFRVPEKVVGKHAGVVQEMHWIISCIPFLPPTN